MIFQAYPGRHVTQLPNPFRKINLNNINKISEIFRYLDFINIMAYDLHGPWDMRIGINAPLYEGLSDVTPLQKQLNVNASIHYWLREGNNEQENDISQK